MGQTCQNTAWICGMGQALIGGSVRWRPHQSGQPHRRQTPLHRLEGGTYERSVPLHSLTLGEHGNATCAQTPREAPLRDVSLCAQAVQSWGSHLSGQPCRRQTSHLSIGSREALTRGSSACGLQQRGGILGGMS